MTLFENNACEFWRLVNDLICEGCGGRAAEGDAISMLVGVVASWRLSRSDANTDRDGIGVGFRINGVESTKEGL